MTDKVLEQFGLTHLKKNNAARLSGGEKRRLEIARCLVCEPLLILLDEPFTGIDPTDHRRHQGRSSAIARPEHRHADHRSQCSRVLKITDRSYLIHEGKVLTQGTPAELVHNEEAIRTYIGHTADGLTFDDGMAPFSSTSRAITTPKPGFRTLVQQDRVQGLLDRLRTPDYAAAANELLQQGAAAIPALVDALESRDMEMRGAARSRCCSDSGRACCSSRSRRRATGSSSSRRCGRDWSDVRDS